MSSVPISQDDLEFIIAEVARDLMEKWAIESAIDEDKLPEYAHLAADVTTFVVEHYMGHLNSLMAYKALAAGTE
jgi:hypothetical protein